MDHKGAVKIYTQNKNLVEVGQIAIAGQKKMAKYVDLVQTTDHFLSFCMTEFSGYVAGPCRSDLQIYNL